MDLKNYEVKEIIQEDDGKHNELIQYLQQIILDRTIPEENKVMVRKQLDEVLRLKAITMPLPKVVLTKRIESTE